MRCERAQRWFSQARDEELSARQRLRLDRHLEACSTCREEYERFQESCGLLGQGDPAAGVELPPELAEAVVARLRREVATVSYHPWRARVDLRVALGIAATLALLLWGDRLHVLPGLPLSETVYTATVEP